MSVPKNAPAPQRKAKKPNYNRWDSVEADINTLKGTLMSGKQYLDTVRTQIEKDGRAEAVAQLTEAYTTLSGLMQRTTVLGDRVSEALKENPKITDADRPTQLDVYDQVSKVTDDYTLQFIPSMFELGQAVGVNQDEMAKSTIEVFSND